MSMPQSLPFGNAVSIPFGALPFGNSELGMARSAEAHEETANRRRQLQAWIDDHFDGLQAEFVREHKLNQGEISGLLRTKSFGSVKARNLEHQTGMPLRYLEQRPSTTAVRSNNSSLDRAQEHTKPAKSGGAITTGSKAELPAMLEYLRETLETIEPEERLKLMDYARLLRGVRVLRPRSSSSVLPKPSETGSVRSPAKHTKTRGRTA